MQLWIVDQPPSHDVVHLDLAGHDLPVSNGVVLTLTDPLDVLEAANTSRYGADWVVWHTAAMPASERRIAAFIVSLARRLRGETFVVLRSDTGRDQRIAGHLLRAGARRATG